MKLDPRPQEHIKKALGKRAADLVQDDMLVGLGSGSTATCFIESLAHRCKQGLKIKAVSSSIRSLELAKSGGIPTIDMDGVSSIDLTVDGADEVDPEFRLIKGKGGAHVREKILANISKQLIVIVDESKCVQRLGKCGLPIEILSFGSFATISTLGKMNYRGAIRHNPDNSFYITDNGNYIFDLSHPTSFADPEKDHRAIINVPGVIDTGFFFNLASYVMIGYADGHIEVKKNDRNS